MATLLWTGYQENLDVDEKYVLEERAAIMEDGNRKMTRDESERLAAADYRRTEKLK